MTIIPFATIAVATAGAAPLIIAATLYVSPMAVFRVATSGNCSIIHQVIGPMYLDAANKPV